MNTLQLAQLRHDLDPGPIVFFWPEWKGWEG